MRWQHLFDDLGAQLEALELQERAAEVAEHTRAERGRVELVHRLVADLGSTVRLRVRGVSWVQARLADVGQDWLLLEVDALGPTGRELLVPVAAIGAAEGLSGRADGRASAASRRFGLRQALRAISRDRARVRVHDVEGEHVTGTVDAVLADHLDLARHADDEPRRRGALRGRVAIPYDALSMVRRL